MSQRAGVMKRGNRGTGEKKQDRSLIALVVLNWYVPGQALEPLNMQIAEQVRLDV
jgi:hypothetical protein